MIKASIIGATGYTGVELVSILQRHPGVELAGLYSHSQAGKKLNNMYPQLIGESEYKLQELSYKNIKQTEVAFTALPHGVSQKIVSDLYNEDLKIIDLSGDFRYSEKSVYEKWYKTTHQAPRLMEKAVYGLVEFNRHRICGADLVANPGCYPTASLLGILPLLKKEIINCDSIIIDAKSGVSGAGKKLRRSTHFIEVDESIKAYNVAEHRHTSEIESICQMYTDREQISLSFTPHLVPMKRGILATIYVDLIKVTEEMEIRKYYKRFYENEPFIEVLPEGILPETKYVRGTNYCHLQIKVDKRNDRLIIISAIDNLGKGAAGQAVQNMNIMFGLKEEMGLKPTSIFP